ncbi:unnamed protein product [Amoebophrya sp. A120]|nr:unnamed protein product [Amoebophrya sp. A120]|eukprot:GSA120T00004450001.1
MAQPSDHSVVPSEPTEQEEKVVGGSIVCKFASTKEPPDAVENEPARSVGTTTLNILSASAEDAEADCATGGSAVLRRLSSATNSNAAEKQESALLTVVTTSTSNFSACAEDAEAGDEDDIPVVRKRSSTRKPTKRDENRIRELKKRFYTVTVRAVLIPVLLVVLLTILRGFGSVCEFNDFARLASVMGTGVFDPTKVSSDGKTTASGSAIGIPTNFAYASFHEAAIGMMFVEVSTASAGVVLQALSPRSLLQLRASLRKHRPALAYVATYAFLCGVMMYAGVFACLVDASRVQSLALFRLVFTPIKVLALPVVLLLFRYSLTRSSAGCSSAVYRFTIVQVGLFVFCGFCLLAVTRIVPALLAAARDLPGYQRIIAETLVCGFFFSIVLPILEKIMGQLLLPRALPTDNDWRLCDFPNARTQQAAQDRTRGIFTCVLHYMFDSMRFGMGRGVFLVLSPATIAFVLFRDLTYHVWHFALRQSEAILVFALKICDFDDLEHVPQSWRWVTKVCYNLQRISSVNRRFSIAFDEEIDFEQQLAEEQNRNSGAGAADDGQQKEQDSGTSGIKKTLALHFSNIRLKIRNVPKKVFRDLYNQEVADVSYGAVQVVPEEPPNAGGSERGNEEAAFFPNLLAMETEKQTVFAKEAAEEKQVNTPMDGRTSGSEARSCENSRVLAGTCNSAGVAVMSVEKALSMPVGSKSHTVLKTSSLRQDVSTGARQAAATTRTLVKFLLGQEDKVAKTEAVEPVSAAELKAFKHCIDFYRQENFKRYQIRAHCRMMTSLTLIFVPLIGLANNVSLFPGFPQTNEEIMFGLIASIIFFVNDIVEWAVITWKFAVFNDEQAEVLLPRFVGIFLPDSEPKQVAGASWRLFPEVFTLMQVTTCFYFLFILTTVMYQPYSLFMLQDEATEQADLTWSHVYEYCGI